MREREREKQVGSSVDERIGRRDGEALRFSHPLCATVFSLAQSVSLPPHE